jgi:hypothetical protein
VGCAISSVKVSAGLPTSWSVQVSESLEFRYRTSAPGVKWIGGRKSGFCRRSIRG